MTKHEQQTVLMNRAYELALQGWGKVSPNPMVGAVIVKGGRVIAEGWHPFCGGPHAEAMAITKAGSKAKGADLYVTLEPCRHVGRTPPCTQAIIDAGIKRVFVGVLDPNPLMNGGSVQLLLKAGISVEHGFLVHELNRLNEAFNKYISTGTPFVTAKIAQTMDGKIAAPNGESKWITADATRTYARDLRFGFDAILVGINTVVADDPALSAEGKSLRKVILDTHLRLSSNAKLFKGTKPADIIVFTTSGAKSDLPATVVRIPSMNGHVDLKLAMDYLGEQEIASVLIEGGGTVIGNALAHKLVDKLMIYTAPFIMGEGLPSVRGLKGHGLKDMVALHDMSIGRIDNDFLIEAYTTPQHPPRVLKSARRPARARAKGK